METAIRELSEWVAKELPTSRRDEEFLKRFLNGCKMRQDVARRKMRCFLNLRTTTPQWFLDRDPSNPILAALINMGVFLTFPDKDDEGRTLVLVRPTLHDPRTTCMNLIFKVGMMVLDAAIEDDPSIAEKGVVVIIDLTGVTARHALQMNLTLISKAVHSWQDCYPVKIKSMHFINCPMHVDAVLSLMKQFMREKLKQRVKTHRKDLTALREAINPVLLPTDYQGTNIPIQDIIIKWQARMEHKRVWFLNEKMEELSS